MSSSTRRGAYQRWRTLKNNACVTCIMDARPQEHIGGLDGHHRVSDPHLADVHPTPLVVHPALGVWSLVDTLNNPLVGTSTESTSLLGHIFHRGRARWYVLPALCAKKNPSPPRTSDHIHPQSSSVSRPRPRGGRVSRVEGHVRDTSGARG